VKTWRFPLHIGMFASRARFPLPGLLNAGKLLRITQEFHTDYERAPRRCFMTLKIGQEAPDFTLPSHWEKDVKLSDLRGSNVVIAFFPLAWTPV
jgi:hypothetical protein